MSMKWYVIMLTVFICIVHPVLVFASDTNVAERVQQHSTEFNPEQFGKQLESKGNELFGVARSGSKLYIGLAFIIFLCLLLVGAFFKKVMAFAFLFLLLVVTGFLIIQFWPQIIEFIIAFLNWLLGKGGTMIGPAPGV
ncbi:hypothetical protein ASL14_19015 [Paenibacillus sp. IHB B 3084]|uniref:hypothetical protein n=1 Tax=Paenibacillus sp. IHB B 3084 TaxID=867076 RepID=UPI000720E88A|nr:hypothetical protein [Paenibacillus sp. IHB B 3084]ALP37964.1 hypothetical protein ASL14_19015 [Paenibacillus sp. IHB B 3084]